MVIGSGELDRMADDAYKDMRITSSIYCGTCGYNLRTLPYTGPCPECGSDYNARALSMKGIFTINDIELPVKEFFLALFCAGTTYILARPLFTTRDTVRAGMAILFAGFSVMYAIDMVGKWGRYYRAVSIMRKIEKEEGETFY